MPAWSGFAAWTWWSYEADIYYLICKILRPWGCPVWCQIRSRHKYCDSGVVLCDLDIALQRDIPVNNAIGLSSVECLEYRRFVNAFSLEPILSVMAFQPWPRASSTSSKSACNLKFADLSSFSHKELLPYALMLLKICRSYINYFPQFYIPKLASFSGQRNSTCLGDDFSVYKIRKQCLSSNRELYHNVMDRIWPLKIT